MWLGGSIIIISHNKSPQLAVHTAVFLFLLLMGCKLKDYISHISGGSRCSLCLYKRFKVAEVISILNEETGNVEMLAVIYYGAISRSSNIHKQFVFS